MGDSIENRPLGELLYLREQTLQKLRRSVDLKEVWSLYQDLKILNVRIERLENAAQGMSA